MKKASETKSSPVLSTEEAAERLLRKPATLRKWACLGIGPIRPVRIAGKLGWRVCDIEALLAGREVAA
jgi:hypothetical protein